MPEVSHRMRKLEEMLQRDPRDPFLLYALALEHRKSGAYGEALRYLDHTLSNDPGYVVAYQQAGQIHELTGDLAAAQEAYRRGIDLARRRGDAHAASEMEAALTLIE